MSIQNRPTYLLLTIIYKYGQPRRFGSNVKMQSGVFRNATNFVVFIL